jgi:ribose phosphate pyrophosphokinase-like protein
MQDVLQLESSSKLVSDPRFRLFALEATADLGKAVAQTLGCGIAAHEERGFEDGEHKVRPLDAVGGTNVYVVRACTEDRRRRSTTSSAGSCSSSARSRMQEPPGSRRWCPIFAMRERIAGPSRMIP